MELNKEGLEKVKKEVRQNGITSQVESILIKLLDYPCPPPYRGELSFGVANYLKFVNLIRYIKNSPDKEALKNGLNYSYYNDNEAGILNAYDILKEFDTTELDKEALSILKTPDLSIEAIRTNQNP